jgi:hypothetical protein
MKFAPLFLLLSLCTIASAATRDQLQIQPTGPLQMSPWRADATVSNPNYDHYIYAVPLLCGYYGYGGYGCSGFYGGYGGGFFNTNAFLLRNVPTTGGWPR